MKSFVLAAALTYSALLRWTPVEAPEPVSYWVETTTAQGRSLTIAEPVLATDGLLEWQVNGLDGDAAFRIVAVAGELATEPSNCLAVVVAPGGVCPDCPPCDEAPSCSPYYLEPPALLFAQVQDDVAINGTALASRHDSDATTFEVELPVAGRWYVWGRFYYPGQPGSNDPNSFWLRLDEGAEQSFGNSLDLFQQWHWAGDGTVQHGEPQPLVLNVGAAGTHYITLRPREWPGPMLDAIYLSTTTERPSDDEARRVLERCSP